MNFTLTRNLTFSQAGNRCLNRFQQTHAKLYRRLMKRLKAVMKKPLIKAVLKFNAAVEKLLKVTMRCAHGIEKTWLFKMTVWLVNSLIFTVRKDGLKFTILLTTLGYSALCYFI